MIDSPQVQVRKTTGSNRRQDEDRQAVFRLEEILKESDRERERE